MQNSNKKHDKSSADRMGRFIGHIRVYEGITLEQLALGLCSTPYLNRVELGEREADKMLTDALLERLGKPTELFERILDWDEFCAWEQRQNILALLRKGDVNAAATAITSYKARDLGVLEQQFILTAEINLLSLQGTMAAELLPLTESALRLSHPDYGAVPLDALLLSHMEGHLLFAILRIREELNGIETVIGDFRSLYRCLTKSRYETRERVYLLPYIACHIIAYEYKHGNYSPALALCEEVLTELTTEKRLFAYDQLLEWKQRLLDALKICDQRPRRLLEHLKQIQAMGKQQCNMLIPYEERGNVYCVNQVIRDRRKLLGISQADLADDICDVTTISRIENRNSSIHKQKRRLLLQRVNMSGERYDYEIITDSYEDYLLRSEHGRAILNNELEQTMELYSQLCDRVPDTLTNQQYLVTHDAAIRQELPHDDPKWLSLQERVAIEQDALRLTIPLDPKTIDEWPTTILSINELSILLTCSQLYKRERQHQKALSVLNYARTCIESTGVNPVYYEDLYTRILLRIGSNLGDLGIYDESSKLELQCLEMSLGNCNSSRLALYLYDHAWNIEHQMQTYPELEQTDSERKVFTLLTLAYAAAVISGDSAGQRHISNHCKDRYGIVLEI